MTMKIESIINKLVTLALLGIVNTMSAQDKLFTLEDLNYGGNNFYNMQPKTCILHGGVRNW